MGIEFLVEDVEVVSICFRGVRGRVVVWRELGYIGVRIYLS